MRLLVIAGLLWGLIGAGPSASAIQNSIDFVELLRMNGQELPAGMVVSGDAAPAASGAGKKDGAPVPPTPRQKALQALEYDRRPSAVLKAWSTPPPEEEKEAEEKTEEEAGGEDKEAEAGAEKEGAAGDAAETDEAEVSEDEGGDGEAGGEEDGDEGEGAEASSESGAALDPEAAAAEKAQAEAAAAAAEAAKAAKEAAAKKAEEAAKEAAKVKAEMAALQRNVTLGDWPQVGEYLRGLSEEERKAGFTQLLASLVKGPKVPNTPFRQWMEKNQFSAQDVFGLAAAAPEKMEKAQLDQLGKILQMAVGQGHLLEECVVLLKKGQKAESFPLGRRQVALLLFGAGYPVEAGGFLPKLALAIERDDREGMNLLARHLVAKYPEDRDISLLEQAWAATQAALATGELEDEIKAEALTRSVELAPKLRDELGQAWLVESFTERPERGMEVLSAIGSAASTGMQTKGRGSAMREKSLSIQTTAAEALLEAAPERATEWQSTLVLLAGNWLREAEYSRNNDTSTSRGPAMQRDVYGNYFYYNYNNRMQRGNQPEPITIGDVLGLKPSERWLDALDASQRPKFEMVFSQLLLKIGEDDEAFPYIEALAHSHPDRAEDLVSEFLQVWIDNHDPNSNRNRTGIYMFSFGYNQRASGIPLTRSKQERNLEELAELVKRLRSLPLEELDDKMLARAFVASHSSAEVYRLDAMERVFGTLGDLNPDTLTELVQTMRANLAQFWRLPSTQEDQKTRRRQKDIQAEVRRGYQVCNELCSEGVAAYPDHWGIQLARAAVTHDENDYQQELKKSAEFSTRRSAALQMFQDAAATYAANVAGMKDDKRSAQAFETWFYAALGASDLGGVDHEKQMASSEIPKIREALMSLPGEAADEHLGMFANSLFTRMSSVSPSVKFRYVRKGLEIVGDDERADEARKVFEYYSDLVTEIELVTRIDGSDRVGHEQPFGLFVDLRHSKEIERESGGFGKYLTNQNNQRYAFNYGRPLEDYRDKFEEATSAALEEHFEVKSITFNKPETHSKSTAESGWRVTPYAYVLLQARGPEIDRVPPLKIDMDFMDTTGYAMVPIESPPLPMDASSVAGEPRPFEELEVVQTLDERQYKDGKLMLEIKAQAAGIVPELEQILDLAPAGFDLANIEDQGVSVAEFDDDSDETRVISERLWLVELTGKEDLADLPKEFRFGESRVEGAKVEFQRYVDADLESVTQLVSLERDYGEVASSRAWLWWCLGGAALLGLILWFRRAGSGEVQQSDQLRAPEQLTPFTVIGFLRAIEGRNHLSEGDKSALHGEISAIERHFFLDDDSSAPDLGGITKAWARKAG